MELSVIIPIYNEKDTLEEIISRVLATGIPEELVLIDDGSTDGTVDIVKKFEGKEGFKVRLLIDAIKGVNLKPQDAKKALALMLKSGAKKMTVDKFKASMGE